MTRSSEISLTDCRLSVSRTTQWLGLFLLFGALYAPAIPGLILEWYQHSTFSYGFLVPLIAGYLVWEQRSALKGLAVAPNLWGAVPLAIAIALGVAGYALGDSFSVRISMVLCLGSLIWLIFGKALLRRLLFPLWYLLLMIPVPYVFIKDLTLYLRYSDAEHSADVLQLLGIPVYRESYFLHIPNMTLEVADVCSGVSSVFALFALGVIYAHYLPLRRGLKALLVTLTFPFAIIANLFRIILTVILAYNFGPVVFETLFHAFSGMFTFVVALFILIGVGEALKKKFPAPAWNAAAADETRSGGNRGAAAAAWNSFTIAAVMLLAGIFVAKHLEASSGIRLAGDLVAAIPAAGYRIAERDAEDGYKDANAENWVSKVLTTRDGSEIGLFIGYRGDQKSGNRLISPRLIFPENWNSERVKPAEFAAEPVHATWILARKGENQELILYWYQIGRRTYASELEHRFEQFRRSVFEGRSDGAVIRLATPVVSEEGISLAQQRLRRLAALLYPGLVKVLPK